MTYIDYLCACFFFLFSICLVDTNDPASLVSGSPSEHHPSVSNSSSAVSAPLYIKQEPSNEDQHKALLQGILSHHHHHHSSQMVAAAALLGYTGTNTSTTTTGKIVR